MSHTNYANHHHSSTARIELGSVPAADSSLRWLVLLLILALLLPAPSAAQAETPSGPTAPSVNAVISLATSPSDSAQVLAGTINTPELSSIFRSADGGATWAPAGTGLRADISIADIAYDPVNPSIVLAADGGFGYLFRSADGGSTWQEVPAFKALIGASSAVGELYSAVVNGTATFYAGTRFDGVLTSTDGGQSWQSLALGLAGEARRVRSFQQFNGVMYAGTHDGVYALDSATQTWIKSAAFPAGIIAYSMVEQGGSLFVGTIGSGLLSSTDGETWTQVAGFPADVSIWDLVSAGTGLVAATDSGVRSGSGEQWLSAAVDGVPNNNAIWALAASSNGTVYAGSSVDWVLRTDDRGFSFGSFATLAPLAASAIPPTPTAVPTLAPIAEATPEQPLVIDVPGAPAEATVVVEEPTAMPTTVPDMATPVPPTDAPASVEATAVPTEIPAAARPEDTSASEVVQLPPIVVGAGLLLLLVIIVAGFVVLRGPRKS
jgi:hypothetical protein